MKKDRYIIITILVIAMLFVGSLFVEMNKENKKRRMRQKENLL